MKNINDMNTREKIEYYKNKIMIGYIESQDINLLEIAYKYLSKDELEHFNNLIDQREDESL